MCGQRDFLSETWIPSEFSFQLDRKKTLFPLRRDCGVKLNFLASDICVHPIFFGLNFDFDFIHH